MLDILRHFRRYVIIGIGTLLGLYGSADMAINEVDWIEVTRTVGSFATALLALLSIVRPAQPAGLAPVTVAEQKK
jgi:hypothetical protein